jgi:mRNA interferase YafQ
VKYKIIPTNKFQKDLKRIKKRGYNISLIAKVIKIIASGEKLSQKYKDHKLSGNYANFRGCHITPDNR